MSWTISITKGPASGVEQRAREAWDANTAKMPEHEEQFEKALEAVKTLVLGVQKDPNGLVAGSISGHANEGFQPKQGWSDSTINISLWEVVEAAQS